MTTHKDHRTSLRDKATGARYFFEADTVEDLAAQVAVKLYDEYSHAIRPPIRIQSDHPYALNPTT